MNRRDVLLDLICWLLVLFTAACSDDLGGNEMPVSSSSNLRLLVPTILSANGTDQSDNSSNNTTYNATVSECQINDLMFYAFPVDDNGNATSDAVVKQVLTAPIATNMLDEHIANYQLRINPGKYHIYAVANMNEALSSPEANVNSEDALKKYILKYTDGVTANLPIATNLPMIYEPKDINGNTLVTDIPEAGNKYTTVAANLKFTCVKVRLNLLFDPDADGSSFAGKSYSIKDIQAQKLSPSTTLSWDGKFSQASSSDISSDYADGFCSSIYDASVSSAASSSAEAGVQGGYYQEGEWTETPANANVNDKDIVEVNDGASATATPQNAAAKWLFQGTYYLPERYIAQASQQSYLKIAGSVNGSVDNHYIISLGHRQDESASSTEVPTFPRGTYYEIVGKIKSLGNINLDCQVGVKDWTPVQIDADFNHTTLWVSKTKASVTSTTTDEITYESNVTLTEDCFGCDTKVTTASGDKPVIVLTTFDAVNKKITFTVNKNIKYSDYNGVYTGTAKVWIKAGNIKKYLDVTYNVAPYFDVAPQEVTIYWESDNNTKIVGFKTNLSGMNFRKSKSENVVVDQISSTVGNSTIQATCDNKVTDEGIIKIVATTDPVTTTVHTFYVQPQDNVDNFDNYVREIKVIVKPAVGNYRINFRAINDRVPYLTEAQKDWKYKYDNATSNYEGTLPEGGNYNWYDGWYEPVWPGDKYQPQEGNHRIYVYTQIGETYDKVDGKAWIFSDFTNPTTGSYWPGASMIADKTNTGWYYKDFANGAKSKFTANGAEGERTIKPGETLIMFSNYYNADNVTINGQTFYGPGYTLHRCPHHLEPGIPLFDYEDHEGWIVYDPTGDPTWHVYDDMPTIENINFTIYSREQTYGWFKVYGVANEKSQGSTDRNQFTIYDNKDNHKSWTCTYENGWWKTVITLKAIKGDHEKDIHIKFVDNDNADANPHLLFGGNSYERYHDTGYFENNAWHPGKPSGVN